jgi:sulfhydrogenase subunit beta (sulfur reductase)
MSSRILDKGAIEPLVSALMTDYASQGGVVIAPQAKRSMFAFAPLEDVSDLRLDYNTSILSPKTVLQPPRETLATTHLGETPSVEPNVEAKPMVIFGVHTCDLRAIQLLDRVFSVDYADPHYIARREQTLIVSLECLRPCDENSFCKDMGTLEAGEGYDLHLTDIGDAYAVRVGTEKGAALLEKYAPRGTAGDRPATEADVKQLEATLGAKWPRFKNHLEFDSGELPALLATAYEHPLWDELDERCFACGSCTNVCPTCYCFNVTDTISLDKGESVRERNWDSCQLDEFATVADGHNFRQTRAARQRHRFLRKGKYIYEQQGMLGCVGCGRCIRTCLVHINIVDGWNAIHRSKLEAGK